jgi:hypothetical protein
MKPPHRRQITLRALFLAVGVLCVTLALYHASSVLLSSVALFLAFASCGWFTGWVFGNSGAGATVGMFLGIAAMLARWFEIL